MANLIEPLALAIGKQLKQREWKLVTAESCTGGGLSYWITAIPGSSAWFERGFITYSNTAKQELLRVSSATLNEFGSVSAQTACEMAAGALQQSQAQVSIAITGIAGPDGGSQDKPVGTVWISGADLHTGPWSVLSVFTGNRQEIREQSIIKALEVLLVFISSGDPHPMPGSR